MNIQNSENREEAIVMLNDLIKINESRHNEFKVYTEMIRKNAGLKQILEESSNESELFVNELRQCLKILQQVENVYSDNGKIHRGWMDLRASFSDEMNRTILDSCEYGDQATLKAYEQVLDPNVPFADEIRDRLVGQRKRILNSYERIKKLSKRLNKIDI
ncbi:MAG TPA: PA2169 family four-helix-bundle protein [Bacteroidia bacterium]